MCLYLMAGSRCCPRCTWEPNLCKSSTRALLPLDSCQGRAHVVDPSLALHRNLKSVCTEERNVKSVCTVDLGCVALELVDVLHVDDLSRSALLPMGLFTIGPAPRLSLAQGSLL